MSAHGHLRLPAAVRHRLGLHGGDRLLLAIDAIAGRLRLYTPTALYALLPDPSTTAPAGGLR